MATTRKELIAEIDAYNERREKEEAERAEREKERRKAEAEARGEVDARAIVDRMEAVDRGFDRKPFRVDDIDEIVARQAKEES